MLRSAALRALVALTLAVAAIWATSSAVLASCLPPQMLTFKDDPTSVVVGGTIVDVTPAAVTVRIDAWWGDGPKDEVEIRRPATDPTVISSTDWNPQVGEGWIIIAARDGEAFTTDVCQQLPDDQAMVTEVVNSLGDPVTPAPSAEPSPIAVDSDAPVGPVLIGVVMAMIVVVAIVVSKMRRTSTRP